MVTPDLGKYGELRGHLESLLRRFPDRPEAADARALLKDVDARYAKLAEDALSAAIETARALVSRGEREVAVSGLKSIASRFGEGPWLQSTGNARIASAIDEITNASASTDPAKASASASAVPLPPGPRTAAAGERLLWGWHARLPGRDVVGKMEEVRPGVTVLRDVTRCGFSDWRPQGLFSIQTRGSIHVGYLVTQRTKVFLMVCIQTGSQPKNYNHAFEVSEPNRWVQASVSTKRFSAWGKTVAPPPGGRVHEISLALLEKPAETSPNLLVGEIQAFSGSQEPAPQAMGE